MCIDTCTESGCCGAVLFSGQASFESFAVLSMVFPRSPWPGGALTVVYGGHAPPLRMYGSNAPPIRNDEVGPLLVVGVGPRLPVS